MEHLTEQGGLESQSELYKEMQEHRDLLIKAKKDLKALRTDKMKQQEEFAQLQRKLADTQDQLQSVQMQLVALKDAHSEVLLQKKELEVRARVQDSCKGSEAAASQQRENYDQSNLQTDKMKFEIEK